MAIHIHTHLHPRRSGISVHVEEIVPALAALGLQVAAFGEGLRDDLPQMTEDEIRAHLEGGGPLLWHAHRPQSLRKGLRLRMRYPNMKVVWTHHGWRRPGWMTRLSLKKADGLIALTEEGARQLEGKATVISHGVVCPGKPVQEDIKSPLTLGIIGRIRPDKGHKDVVDAFLSLKEDFSDWHLLFCGEIRPQHRRFARALIERGKGRIVHQPYNMDREALYAGLSIVVMSSHAEGFSLVVPESMAHGRPLLASRLPHFEVLFKEEVHALAFDTGNSNDLQRQLRRLMGDAPLRNRLSKAAREHAESHLGIAREAKALATLYAAILN